MKHVTAKPAGIVISCGQNGALGVLRSSVRSFWHSSRTTYLANRVKSGLFTIKVAKLDRQDIIPRLIRKVAGATVVLLTSHECPAFRRAV